MIARDNTACQSASPTVSRCDLRIFCYLGFGTCFALGALFFFFAALAFACFCAACLCVAFGDLSPIIRRVSSTTNGVNTDAKGFRAKPAVRCSFAQLHDRPEHPGYELFCSEPMRLGTRFSTRSGLQNQLKDALPQFLDRRVTIQNFTAINIHVVRHLLI